MGAVLGDSGCKGGTEGEGFRIGTGERQYGLDKGRTCELANPTT